MQTKKRAKPVKFGVKSEKEEKKVTPAEKITKEDIGKEEANIEKPFGEKKEVSEEPNGESDKPHGIEAHYSKTTIDIKEITDNAENDGEDREDKVEIIEDTEAEEEPASEDEVDELPATSDDEISEAKSEDTTSPEEDNTVSADEKEESEESEEAEIEPEKKNDDYFNAPPDEYDRKKSMLPYFLMIVVVTFILGVVFFAGIYYAVSNKPSIFPSTKKTDTEVTQSPEVTTPTEKPVDLSLYSIQVLNGTSTSGVAAKAKEQLAAAGFKVSSIGNAKTDDFEKTEISAAKKVDKEYLDKLKEILSKKYVLGSISELAGGSADVAVTIGSASAK